MSTERFENRVFIGSGGMATVYRAWDNVVLRDVALKEVAEELRDDPEVRKMFLGEARKMAQVVHPHVVQVYDVLLRDDVPTIVQEFMNSGSLANVVGASRMTGEETLHLLEQVFSGLNAIHQAGLVHRDMKPDNILLNNGDWKVADFGVAMRGDEDVLPFIGSKYAAPEVINEPEAISERSDIYSMGVVAMELLLGSDRFEAAAREALLLAHGTPVGGRDSAAAFWQRWVSSNVELPLLSELDPVISPEIAEFVARLAARDPQLRPPDCAAVLAELAQLRDGELMRMRAPTAQDPRIKSKQAAPSTRKKTPLWFRVTLAVGLVLLLAVAALLLLPSSPSTLELQVVTDPPGADITINGAGTGTTTPALVTAAAGDVVVLSLPSYVAQEMTLAKGLEGLGRDANDVLTLSRALQRSYSLDDSESAQEYFGKLWSAAPGLQATIPTALETTRPYRLPTGRALYIAIRPPASGALTFIHLGSDDVATLVYPSPDDSTLGVRANRSVTVGDELDMAASEPLGREWILLVLTREPLKPPTIDASGQVEDWARSYEFGGDNSPAEQLLRWLATEVGEKPLGAAVVPIEVVRMERRAP